MSYWGCTLSFIIPFSQRAFTLDFIRYRVSEIPTGYLISSFLLLSRFFFAPFSFSNQSIFFSFRREHSKRVVLEYKCFQTLLKFHEYLLDKYQLTNNLVPHLHLWSVLFFDTQRLHVFEEQLRLLILSTNVYSVIFFPSSHLLSILPFTL